MNGLVKTWSFSVLTKFEKCPYMVYLMKVEKHPEPEYEKTPDHPLVRGDRIHEEAERFVTGEGPFTPALKKFQGRFEGLRQAYSEGRAEVEQKWGFTYEWAPCSWNDPDNRAYIKLDIAVNIDPGTAEVIDYKTGKSFGKEVNHAQQLQIYTIAKFLRTPELNVVKASNLYLDEGKEKPRTYTRPQAMDMLARWQPRIDALLNCEVFKPKANRSNCKYCPYGISTGTGVCPYAAAD